MLRFPFGFGALQYYISISKSLEYGIASLDEYPTENHWLCIFGSLTCVISEFVLVFGVPESDSCSDTRSNITFYK